MKEPPFFILLLLILIFEIYVVLVSGVCQSDQQSLLLQFNSSLTFNSSVSTKLSRWNPSSDCCSWPGVRCDADALGRVVGLNLSNESISGGIEKSGALFSLQYLQDLDLSYNNFSTLMPSSFANLTGLISLNLSNAGFFGQIPVEVSNMTNLVTLDLSMSGLYFKGRWLELENPNLTTLVENLTKLQELHLDGLNLSGSDWVRALSFSLPNLQVLSLSNCFLSGPIDPSLVKLKSLSVIRLDGNNLASPVPKFFANFPRLRSLRLSSCKLKGTFPASVFLIATLETIDASYNQQLQGQLQDSFQNSSLKTLDLSYTNFSGTLPKSIGALRNLTKIVLSSCKFSGPIPTSMANLKELVYLDFSANMFNGSIPPFSSSRKLTYMDFSNNTLSGDISDFRWEGLSDLVYVDLSHNSLNGSIPSSLFTISPLQKILLSFNRFGGQISDISNASFLPLDTLDLSNNMLEGPIPRSVFELRRLKVLSLASNKLNGTIKLVQMQKLVNLSSVDLSYNNLTVDANSKSSLSPQVTTLKLASCNLRVFPDLRNQSKLIHLDLSDNQITGSVPPWIGQVGNGSLNSLNLSRNLLVSLPEPLSFPSSLAKLDLHRNQLQGNIPTPPQFVSVLDYSDNKFSSSIPNDIGKYLSVAILFSIANNSVEGFIPQSLCNATYLQVLDLSNNNLSGALPSCLIERCEILGVLNLRKNNLSSIIPDKFPGKCGLKTLDLNGNSLEGKVPISLINCSLLEVLDLGSNGINDTFPCLLRNLSNLRALVLRSNFFHGDLISCPSISPSTNPTWTKLQIIDIALNNFSGRLPDSILRSWKAMIGDGNETRGHLKFEFLPLDRRYYQDSITVTSKGLEMQLVKILTVFTSIDVSCNNFDGEIPTGLGNLNVLYGLNLSHNNLGGEIPHSLGNLSHLESLDLSSNKLTGQIPQELAGLTFFSFLNLSYNNLSGRIPTGTQLQTFSEASFEGNKGLCGPPLQPCSDTPSTRKDKSQIRKRDEFDWEFIVPGMGFGAGAALSVAPLLFSKKVNQWCDDRIDKILMVLLPMLGLVYYTKDDWRIELDDSFKEDTTDDDDSDYDDDDAYNTGGRYCVFCTKLDVTRTLTIHDLKCTCFHSLPISSSSSSSFASSDSS